VKIELVQVSKLTPYVNNSRTHTEEQIAQIVASISEYGFTNPVLIGTDNDIIAGHARVQAARSMSMKSVPCIRLGHLTDEQKRAYVIADNKLALNAGWDDDMLRLELEALKDLDFDISLTGFTQEEFEAMFEVEELEDDIDTVPLPPKDPRTKQGEVWVLGRHRLMCGDSTKKEHVERLMNGKQADLWVTDPPYNVAYVGKTKDALTIQNDKMDASHYKQFLIDAFSCAFDSLKPGASYYIWHADLEGHNVRNAIVEIGQQIRQCLVWVKDSMVMGRQDYHWQHEPCLYGWREGAAHKWFSDRTQTTILNFDRPTRNAEHPTMKPVALILYLIKNSMPKKGLVLDTFLGSGTTLIAAEEGGGTCYGMELDPAYCDVVIERWEKLTGGVAVKEQE